MHNVKRLQLQLNGYYFVAKVMVLLTYRD